MNLTILLPTHNRPSLFQRCLDSIINKKVDVEVIVNNDSNDIEEVADSRVSYFYERFDHLSQVYEFLLSKATRQYVYFLEDDDYLKNGFFDAVAPLLNKYDIISGNYRPTFTEEILTTHINGTHDNARGFIESLNFDLIQLSKFVFRTDTIRDYAFNFDSNVHNDVDLLLHATTKSKQFICVPNIFFFQTIDGKDNISFPQFTKVDGNYDFLDKYKSLI